MRKDRHGRKKAKKKKKKARDRPAGSFGEWDICSADSRELLWPGRSTSADAGGLALTLRETLGLSFLVSFAHQPHAYCGPVTMVGIL